MNRSARRVSLATFAAILLLLTVTPSSAEHANIKIMPYSGVEIVQEHTTENKTTTSPPPEPPEKPPCEDFIDLSTGTGNPLVAQPPGTPSDPVGDWPDWGLINASANTSLQQPVVVNPYPGWYSGGPVAWGNAAWITIYATNGSPSRLSGTEDYDAWYEINFTLQCTGKLELWFTADDKITLYLNGNYLASHSNLATLGYVSTTLQPGSYSLVAHVDDTHKIVTGFLVYGWVCVYCECPNETVTVTETVTTTVTKTETTTIINTTTVTETVTSTTTVTQWPQCCCCCCCACQPYTPTSTTNMVNPYTTTIIAGGQTGDEGSLMTILRSGTQSLVAAFLAAVLVYVLLARR